MNIEQRISLVTSRLNRIADRLVEYKLEKIEENERKELDFKKTKDDVDHILDRDKRNSILSDSPHQFDRKHISLYEEVGSLRKRVSITKDINTELANKLTLNSQAPHSSTRQFMNTSFIDDLTDKIVLTSLNDHTSKNYHKICPAVVENIKVDKSTQISTILPCFSSGTLPTSSSGNHINNSNTINSTYGQRPFSLHFLQPFNLPPVRFPFFNPNQYGQFYQTK